MRRRPVRTLVVAIAAVILLAGVVAACGGARSGGGKRTPRTPSGWPITPAGKLITVPAGDPGLPGPWGVALSPNGKFALVSSSGAAVQYETTELFNLATDHRTAIRSYNGRKSRSVFYGVVFSPDGRHAWAAGAGQNVVHAYAVGTRGQLTPTGQIKAPYFPAGLAYGPRESTSASPATRSQLPSTGVATRHT